MNPCRPWWWPAHLPQRGVRIRLGFGEGSGIRSSRDRPEPCAGRIARRRTVSIGWDGESGGYRWVSTVGKYGAAVVLVVLAFGGGWLYWSNSSHRHVRYATQKIELGSMSAP